MLKESGVTPEKRPIATKAKSDVPLFHGPTDRINHENRMLRNDMLDRLSIVVRGSLCVGAVVGALALIGCGESEKISAYCSADSALDGDGVYSIKHRLFPNIDAVSARAVDVFVGGTLFEEGSVPLGDRVKVCVDANVADLAAGKNVHEGID